MKVLAVGAAGCVLYLMYFIFIVAFIALMILGVLTVLEWGGLDVPNFMAPSLFGFHGIKG